MRFIDTYLFLVIAILGIVLSVVLAFLILYGMLRRSWRPKPYPQPPLYIPIITRRRRIGKASLVLLSIVLAISNIVVYVNLQNLSKQYEDLNKQYEKLNNDYVGLRSNCNSLKAGYQSLNNSVSELFKILHSYHTPEAFKRCLNDEEIQKTASAVSPLSNENDFWGTQERIYNYITSNVAYAYDIDVPYVTGLDGSHYDSKYYVVRFTVGSVSDYAQSPSLTLKIRRGDCEDQAMLAYAMIKYYEKYIYGKEYSLYIMDVIFQDSAHLAVIRPVEGGKICVIDPAGHYLTSKSDWWGLGQRITCKDAAGELQAYSNYWMFFGGIKYVRLYDVNVSDGSYRVVAEGNLSEIATFLGRE